MTSKEIRSAFIKFFKEKNHRIIPSAPMVLKNDPTLMFTNAGMNQFKDVFLGNRKPDHPRVADTQKCLRVTGKHNDLEEVGHDNYHHTMFEMLGNWSFGDYFKKEAIEWAWEFLTQKLNLEPDRLYTTYFEGDPDHGIEMDKEARDLWKSLADEAHVLSGKKKDNFWEMGDTGPCGPCSEIHLDMRDDGERKQIPGHQLVNRDHPEVIELWNLVFIQYNRKAGGDLESLPEKHVDTGLGFERLCMAIQEKKSSYETDLFQPLIREIASRSGKSYGTDPSAEVAMRVVADHLRAVSFAIADGQLPSNTGAGYVIRRILRRAVRYAFTYLDQGDPFIHGLVPVLAATMADAFPEIESQKEHIQKVIREEEQTFLSTLENGMKMLDQLVEKAARENRKKIPGNKAFELYDTFGFPFDLTRLILSERGYKVDEAGFEQGMKEQKARSRKAAESEASDWTELRPGKEVKYVGYDQLSARVMITRYRKVSAKKGERFQLVFDVTPFYAESGGQIGDRGYIENNGERIEITDTVKENELIIHITGKLPSDPSLPFNAQVNEGRRINTANNHTATHLMHHALREVLGPHVEQKGSLVDPEYLRFDFSHFQKVTGEELREVEKRVNRMIRHNSPREEHRSMPMKKALDMGAMALFGEKYGEEVRVIKFGETVELCGGTHVESTGQIGIFRILKESSIAAGIRRIEAVTGEMAESYVNEQLDTLKKISELLENRTDLVTAVEQVLDENSRLSKTVEHVRQDELTGVVKRLVDESEQQGGTRLIVSRVKVEDPSSLRDLAFKMKSGHPDFALVLGAEVNGKAHLAIMFSDKVRERFSLDASRLIREIAADIKGGGGGQPFFATAGGRDPAGIDAALAKARTALVERLKS